MADLAYHDDSALERTISKLVYEPEMKTWLTLYAVIFIIIRLDIHLRNFQLKINLDLEER